MGSLPARRVAKMRQDPTVAAGAELSAQNVGCYIRQDLVQYR